MKKTILLALILWTISSVSAQSENRYLMGLDFNFFTPHKLGFSIYSPFKKIGIPTFGYQRLTEIKIDNFTSNIYYGAGLSNFGYKFKLNDDSSFYYKNFGTSIFGGFEFDLSQIKKFQLQKPLKLQVGAFGYYSFSDLSYFNSEKAELQSYETSEATKAFCGISTTLLYTLLDLKLLKVECFLSSNFWLNSDKLYNFAEGDNIKYKTLTFGLALNI